MDTVRAAIQDVNEIKKLQRDGFIIPMQYKIDCIGNMYNAIRTEARHILGMDTYESLNAVYKECVKRYVECNAKYTDARLISNEQYSELYELNKAMVEAEYNVVACVYDALDNVTSDETNVSTTTF